MTTEADTKRQELQDTNPPEHTEGGHQGHHGRVNANVPAPAAGNAANEAKALDETGESDSLIAAKQTGEDPRGAGESGHGISGINPLVETPEQPPMPVGDQLHEQHLKGSHTKSDIEK